MERNGVQEAETPSVGRANFRIGKSVGLSAPGLPRGRGIPRLQELSFLEVAVLAVASGATFEDVRGALVAHMMDLRRNNAGTGNVATFRLAKNDPKRYVRNATESLKELMRLGLVASATLPSSARAARAYKGTTFGLTEAGRRWAALLRNDLKTAYNELLGMLWHVHPQFQGFLQAVSVDRNGLVVPLAHWGALPLPRTRDRYMHFLAERVAEALMDDKSGWMATAPDVFAAVTDYIETLRQNARDRDRPDPHPRNQDFVRGCEEAVVKFAFSRCGVSLDYISQEILRRWTKVLGVASFSYHVPGTTALRIWPTAVLELADNTVVARRRTGGEYVAQVITNLRSAYEQVRKGDSGGSLWVPIYRVRAAVCHTLLIPDAVFDRALIELMQSKQVDVPYGINVDQSQYGSVPPTEVPLRVETSRGVRNYYSMSLVLRREKE